MRYSKGNWSATSCVECQHLCLQHRQSHCISWTKETQPVLGLWNDYCCMTFRLSSGVLVVEPGVAACVSQGITICTEPPWLCPCGMLNTAVARRWYNRAGEQGQHSATRGTERHCRWWSCTRQWTRGFRLQWRARCSREERRLHRRICKHGASQSWDSRIMQNSQRCILEELPCTHRKHAWNYYIAVTRVVCMAWI